MTISLLTPVELPSGCSCDKMLGITQHISLGVALVSTISAIFSAIILSPSYFLLSLATLTLSLLASYHIRLYISPPTIVPPSITPEFMEEHMDNMMEEYHHEHPQADPEVTRDLIDNLLLKHVPSALTPERRAELEADLVPDSYEMSRAEIKNLKEEIEKRKGVYCKQKAYLETLIPESPVDHDEESLDSCSDSEDDDMEEPVLVVVKPEKPTKVPHLEQDLEVLARERYCHYNPQPDPEAFADIVDHLLLKHVPSALSPARQAELAAELLPDTSKMSESDINHLKKEIEERKAVLKRQRAYLEALNPDRSKKSKVLKKK